MNANNKGMTIIEILLSIVIIGIVLILLFTLLSQVKHEDKDNNIQSNFIINQSTFIKSIEEDIVNYGVKSISSCNLSDANISSYTVVTGDEENFKCLRIEYAADYIKDNIGYIMIYNYYTNYDLVNGMYQGKDSSWAMQYVRGSYHDTCLPGILPNKTKWVNATTLMKEIPSEVDLEQKPYVLYTAMSGNTTNAASIVIPIVNLDGEHYDINLSFTFKGNQKFKCYDKLRVNGNLVGDTSFTCNCSSGDSLCNQTKGEYTYTCNS